MGIEDFKVMDISELSLKCGDNYTVLTKEQWMKRGTDLFGEDMMKWKFVCPACGNVAAVGDYFPYKDQGAKPDSATHKCIGRFNGHGDVVMGSSKPCNYTGYGLVDICPVRVLDEGKEVRSFAFAES